MVVLRDIKDIKTEEELLKRAKWLEGKTLAQIEKEIRKEDPSSRVKTKGQVGYVIEKGFFGINKNSESTPDLAHLGVEVKTCPLKYGGNGKRLSIKEPLSLNIINYFKEVEKNDIQDSSFYKKGKKILFVLYIHDKSKKRSDYLIKYVFLWKMDDKVLDELRPDYDLIIKKIREGLAHQIHQAEHKYLTLCPKHNGTFRDPNEMTSKRKQPFSKEWAEVRAFRLKNRYMNLVVSKHLGKELKKGGWDI